LLDFSLMLDVIREEMTRDPNVRVTNIELRLKEDNEESDHLRIRIGKAQLVAAFRSFGPVEHAAGQMERLGCPSEASAALLSGNPLCTVLSCVLTPSTELSVIGGVLRPQGRLLLRRQLDVSYPDAD